MKKPIILISLGVVLVVIGITLTVFIAYRNSEKADDPLVFADRTMLNALWDDYKQEYWEKDTGRTLDKELNNITTSEGQSYTMLRAVWTSDQATFDKTWDWTQEQLQRNDGLLAWKWGEKPDGSYGILEDEGGQNTASDGDVDTALALIMAAGRWQEQGYLDEAKKMIPSIWNKQVLTIIDKPYLAANDLEKLKQPGEDVIINPSYFAPYSFREFARVDPSNDWEGLVNSSYELINKSLDEQLDKSSTANLPPDWFLIDQKTGEISATQNGDLTSNYSFDAMRTPWRLALDYQWNKDQRAKDTLEKMSFLTEQWNDNGKLISTYTHDGKAVTDDEVPAIYGGNLGYFKVIDPENGQKIYDTKLKTLYDPTNNSWIDGISYYSDNWAWFGMALYDEQLDNPARELKVKSN